MPTALIVEDEPEANKLLAMLLQLRGYRTESAYRGAEALEKIRDHAPDVVFLDLMLPDMDGYEVCRSLKTPGGVSVVPVVIVTARLTAENRIESFEAGADDYIPKPYTPDQIFEALEQSARLEGPARRPRLDGEVAARLAGRRRDPAAPGAAPPPAAGPMRPGARRDRPDQLGDQGAVVEHRRLVAATAAGAGRHPGLLADPGGADADHPRRGRMAVRHALGRDRSPWPPAISTR